MRNRPERKKSHIIEQSSQCYPKITKAQREQRTFVSDHTDVKLPWLWTRGFCSYLSFSTVPSFTQCRIQMAGGVPPAPKSEVFVLTDEVPALWGGRFSFLLLLHLQLNFLQPVLLIPPSFCWCVSKPQEGSVHSHPGSPWRELGSACQPTLAVVCLENTSRVDVQHQLHRALGNSAKLQLRKPRSQYLSSIMASNGKLVAKRQFKPGPELLKMSSSYEKSLASKTWTQI